MNLFLSQVMFSVKIVSFPGKTAVQQTQLFKSFEFGNGSRMSDENLVILEFKYLQNKK